MYCVHIGVTEKALGKIYSLRDGRKITYSKTDDLDFHCCEACAEAFNDNKDHRMKLLIRPGHDSEPCDMKGCTDKGKAHKYRVCPGNSFNTVLCFDNNIAVDRYIPREKNGVIYIDCFQKDRPFCRTTYEKGWTCEIINDDPLDKNLYAFGTRLKVLSPDQNKKKHDAKTPPQENSLVGGPDHEPRLKLSTKAEEQEDPNVFDCSHPICDSGPLRLHTAEVNMCPSCVRSHTKDGYTDCVLHDDYLGGDSYSTIICAVCNESFSLRLKLTRYNYPITQLEPIGNTEWCEPRLKLSTKRKADEEATDTEDDSDRDTKRIKKSNLTRMNADSEMYGLLKCNVEAREKKQEECGTVGDIDLLHLCYGCKLDALKEKAFELVCIPFPLDDNEYKYYACEREGCRTAEVGCGNIVKRA